jgi:hypothetical protein
MSAPSRRPEIRRRRTRNEKIVHLRKLYSAARSDADRSRILEKVKKLSKGMTQEEFLKPLQAS